MFDWATISSLADATFSPSLWRQDRKYHTLPDGEQIVVFTGWRWGHGVVLVLRAPSSMYVEYFFSKMPKPKKGELDVDIAADWVPEAIGWTLPLHVKNNTARSWGKQIREALNNAGDLRSPNIPKKFL